MPFLVWQMALVALQPSVAASYPPPTAVGRVPPVTLQLPSVGDILNPGQEKTPNRARIWGAIAYSRIGNQASSCPVKSKTVCKSGPRAAGSEPAVEACCGAQQALLGGMPVPHHQGGGGGLFAWKKVLYPPPFQGLPVTS